MIESQNNSYFTLLVYLDGIPAEIEEFKNVVKMVSKLSASIVFVGIGGDSEFELTNF